MILFSGECGKVDTNKKYESLIDYSSDLIMKYGKDSDEYKKGLKEVFTNLNYSLNNEMINYYRSEAPYFLDSLELLK